MRVVCVRHSKRIEVPARDRLDDEDIVPTCPLPGPHGPKDLLIAPREGNFPTSEAAYNMKLAEFEMFWQQAI